MHRFTNQADYSVEVSEDLSDFKPVDLFTKKNNTREQWPLGYQHHQIDMSNEGTLDNTPCTSPEKLEKLQH